MTNTQAGLRKEVRASQFFTLSFGAIVGVGWIVVLGGWLGHAGPLGAALAFVAGGLVMILIGLCYAEMASLLPVSGGEIAYAFEVFGLRTAYAVGWALALMNTAAVAYVCISMAWILDVLIPGIQGPALYTFRGEVVHAGSTLVALFGTGMLTYLNYRGVRTAASFQSLFTYGKIGIALIFIAAGFIGGSTANLQPLFKATATGAIWPGILAVFIQTPWWLGGFNTVPQVMEEKSPNTSLQTVARVMVLSIFMAALFYAIVILSASMAVPWQRLVSADLPAAAAFREAFRSQIIARLVLVAGLLGIVTVGNACCLAASRVLFALSRASIIPPLFSDVHPRFGSPARAVVFVGAIASFGVLLGRGGILPVVSIGATCLALGYVITALGVIRLRQTDPARVRPYRVPGGAATAAVASAAAFFLFGMSVYQPYADAKGSLPLEWIVILAWSALGLALWMFATRLRASVSDRARRDIIIGARESETTERVLQPT